MKVIAQTAGASTRPSPWPEASSQLRTPKPVLQCVKLIAANNVLTLLATDLEAGLRYQLTAVQVEEEGEAPVPADRLAGIATLSADEETLTLQTVKDQCQIVGKASRFKIFGYDPAEYPAVPEFTDAPDFQVKAGDLAGMINRTLFATAKAHSHYAISGVLWEASGKKLQMVATDGHRLAQAKGSLVKAAARDVTAIVPAKLMGLIQRIATAAEETVEIKVLENQILVRTARAVLTSAGPRQLPEVRRRDPSRDLAQGHHQPPAARAPRPPGGPVDQRGVQGRAAVVRQGHRHPHQPAPESGEAEVTCPAELEGEPMDIAFNPAFLVDALKVAGAKKYRSR